MKWTIIVLLNALLSCVHFNCMGQANKPVSLKLQVYKVYSCLYKLLAKTAESNKTYYPTDKYFYSVTFVKGTKSSYISVTPESWLNVRDLDYGGILKIDSAAFLFRGDFQKDSIFRLSDLPRTEVTLQKEETGEERFYREPSLQGFYKECRVYIEIYTKGKVADFEMMIIR